MTTAAVIVDAVRSPMGRGRPTGALAGQHPVDLLAQVLSALVERSSLDPALVDDVLIGCVSQAGEQSATPGRQGARRRLADPRPVGDDRTQVRLRPAGGRVRRGGHRGRLYDIAVAGGVESMSRVPMGSARMGKDPFGPRVREVPGPGATGGLGRTGGPALEPAGPGSTSMPPAHARADATRVDGGFKDEIVPVQGDGSSVVADDETIQAGTTVQRLGELALSAARRDGRALPRRRMEGDRGQLVAAHRWRRGFCC